MHKSRYFTKCHLSIMAVYSVNRNLLLRRICYKDNCNSWCRIVEQYVSEWSQFEMGANRSSLINDWSVDCVMLRISNWLKLPSRSTQCETLHETVCTKLWGKGECCLEYICISILRTIYIDSPGLTNPNLMTC